MLRIILFVVLLLPNIVFSQYWQEQVVLKGEVLSQCFDLNEDILISSELSNEKFAVCRYSVEKDSIVQILLVTNKVVEFIEVLSDGTIMAFQDYQLLKSTDDGESWIGYENEFNLWQKMWNCYLEEIDEKLLFWDCGQYYSSYDGGLSWRVIQNEEKKFWEIKSTLNNCFVGRDKNQITMFSSDFGLTWEKTNLDTLKLCNFRYSNTNETVYAISWFSNKKIYKSEDGGKYWEMIDIETDSSINSYAFDSHGNLYIMDKINRLYKYLSTTNELRFICDNLNLPTNTIYPVSGQQKKVGLDVNNTDNLYYYDLLESKFYKFDFSQNIWNDSLNLLKDDSHPQIFLQKSFYYSKENNKIIVNSREKGLHLVYLENDNFSMETIPSGAEALTEFFDLGPNGELVFATFHQYYDVSPEDDSSLYYVADYSISKDGGFSRKKFLSDSIYAYDSASEITYEGITSFSGFAFFDSLLCIMSYNKTFKIDLADWSIEKYDNPEFEYRIPSIIGASPDGNIYLFQFGLSRYQDISHPSDYNQLHFMRSSDYGKSWDLLDSSFDNNYVNVRNLQFLSNGDIFVNTRDIRWDPLYYSTDKGITWKSHGFSQGSSITSIYTDNRDNLYYDLSGVTITSSYKNWEYWNDTFDIVASKCGDIFANAYINETFGDSKVIYSSDYGESWVDYYKYISFDERYIESNDRGDLYNSRLPRLYFGEDHEYFNLKKFIREPGPKPHPLSDTTFYSVYVDVDEYERIPKDRILIYPNPAREYIEIKYKDHRVNPMVQGVQIEIYNSLGIRLYSSSLKTSSSMQQIDINHLAPGFYFINISNHDFQTSRKLIIHR